MSEKQKSQTPATKTYKAYEVILSGTYRVTKEDYVDFENVKGIIPAAKHEEFASAMARVRYAPMWIGKDPKYKKRVRSMREVFIDDINETESEFSFVGKNIKEMTYEELQDLATAKDLRAVPLYKKAGLRQTQIIAYAEYSLKILGEDIEYKKVGFNFADCPPLVVPDANPVDNETGRISNEDIIEQEMNSTSPQGAKTTLTRAELEKIATDKRIPFNPAISDSALYNKIFNA